MLYRKVHNMISNDVMMTLYLFHDGGRYHIETSPLICRADQWTGFYMITASVMKELIQHSRAAKQNNNSTFQKIYDYVICKKEMV